MSFIQVIEYKTTRIDEIRELGEKFRANQPPTDGGPTRITITEDRDEPQTYRTIVEFRSYDEAMANSNRPETDEFAQQMAALVDGPPRFYNLDVIAQMEP